MTGKCGTRLHTGANIAAMGIYGNDTECTTNSLTVYSVIPIERLYMTVFAIFAGR